MKAWVVLPKDLTKSSKLTLAKWNISSNITFTSTLTWALVELCANCYLQLSNLSWNNRITRRLSTKLESSKPSRCSFRWGLLNHYKQTLHMAAFTELKSAVFLVILPSATAASTTPLLFLLLFTFCIYLFALFSRGSALNLAATASVAAHGDHIFYGATLNCTVHERSVTQNPRLRNPKQQWSKVR